MTRHRTWIFIAMAFCVAVSAQAGDPRWHDPFAPPAQSPVIATEATTSAAEEPEPQLRAILYDKQNVLVNISGHLLVPGEEISGWRLVKVGERSIILAKNGKRLKLTLDKD